MFNKKKKSKALNLTPLIDVMTTLIIFILIQSSDAPIDVDDSIVMAKSQYGELVKKNEVLTVGLNEISLGDDYKVEISKGKIPKKLSHKSESKLIQSLYKKIINLKEMAGKDEIDLNLLFDKRLPADSVKKVIYTVTMAGVNNIYYISEKNQ